MPLFDAHCHLQDDRIDESVLAETLRGYTAIGVRRCVVNGIEPGDWDRVAALGRGHEVVLPSFGLHPWKVNSAEGGWETKLRALLEAFPDGGVGEIGLDKWIRDYDLPAQQDAFRRQLRLAAELERPVSIHCLKAWGPLLDTLRSEPLPARGFLMHSYGGSRELAAELSELGAYFSVSGYFARERKREQREVFRSLPIDRLLVETDAPDMLGPEECVSKDWTSSDGAPLNHPLNLDAIYRFAARLRGMSDDAFAAQMEDNWRRLFGG